MSIDDFDDLEDTLNEMEDEVDALGGDDDFSFDEVLTDAFIQANTDFRTVSQFTAALPDYDDADDFFSSDEVQQVIDDRTPFEDLDDMLAQVAAEEVTSDLDF